MSYLTTSTNLLFGLPLFLLSGSSISNILLPIYPASLLRTCPNQLNLASFALSPNSPTWAVPLTYFLTNSDIDNTGGLLSISIPLCQIGSKLHSSWIPWSIFVTQKCRSLCPRSAEWHYAHLASLVVITMSTAPSFGTRAWVWIVTSASLFMIRHGRRWERTYFGRNLCW